MRKIDVLVGRTVTFFMFTAIPTTGLNSTPKTSDTIETTGIAMEKDLAIGPMIEMASTERENASLIVMIEIIRTGDEDARADHAVAATMITIARSVDIVAGVNQRKGNENAYLLGILKMENRQKKLRARI